MVTGHFSDSGRDILSRRPISAKVTILYRDMQMYGVENEELFRASKMSGVCYINYAPENPPLIEEGKVTVLHQLMGKEITLDGVTPKRTAYVKKIDLFKRRRSPLQDGFCV